MKKRVLLFLVAATFLRAAPMDVKSATVMARKGADLSSAEAAALEMRLAANSDDEEARIQLLSWYTLNATAGTEARRAGRARQILWLIGHDPKNGSGLFGSTTGIYRVHCQGDELADQDSFQAAAQKWMQEISRNPAEPEIRRHAVAAIQYCAPEKAEELLNAAQNPAGLGALYANAVLGVTGQSYTSYNDPAGADASFRERDFSKRALEQLEGATDRDLMSNAAATLLQTGAQLWADSKLDWDYTIIGNRLLDRARQIDPSSITLFAVPTQLPMRGERPPLTLRIGGNVAAKNLVKQPAPQYPKEARQRGIQGTVRMSALIGPDGKIAALHVESGPAELVPMSIQTVRRWEYKPTPFERKASLRHHGRRRELRAELENFY